MPALGRYDGMVWFRAHVKLDKPRRRSRPRQLSLGLVDDVDVTWVNGRAVGNGFGDGSACTRCRPKLLKAGDNVVVVNVHDFWGNGGMHGPAAERALLLADGTRVAAHRLGIPGRAAGTAGRRARPGNPPGVNMLYNAMIAPLGKYGLRGVAWYQGEANAGLDDARRTRRCSRRWMADWRRQFDAPLPFLIVQLANFGHARRRAGR